jgi:hypothetical protein
MLSPDRRGAHSSSGHSPEETLEFAQRSDDDRAWLTSSGSSLGFLPGKVADPNELDDLLFVNLQSDHEAKVCIDEIAEESQVGSA